MSSGRQPPAHFPDGRHLPVSRCDLKTDGTTWIKLGDSRRSRVGKRWCGATWRDLDEARTAGVLGPRRGGRRPWIAVSLRSESSRPAMRPGSLRNPSPSRGRRRDAYTSCCRQRPPPPGGMSRSYGPQRSSLPCGRSPIRSNAGGRGMPRAGKVGVGPCLGRVVLPNPTSRGILALPGALRPTTRSGERDR